MDCGYHLLWNERNGFAMLNKPLRRPPAGSLTSGRERTGQLPGSTDGRRCREWTGDPRIAARFRSVLTRLATLPQWPRIKLVVARQYLPVCTRPSLGNPSRKPRRFRDCRPRHYPLRASDTGGFAQWPPCPGRSPPNYYSVIILARKPRQWSS